MPYYRGLFTTSTINQLTKGIIRQIYIPLPPDGEQTEIAAYLDKICSKIDNATANIQKQISELLELKTRLIFDTVTGKIDVREFKINEEY